MDKLSCLFLGIVLGAFSMAIAMSFSKEPMAIDVYQGKTTLKYTIVDGVVTDSVVVFKEKK
jgi:hypothetical protein